VCVQIRMCFSGANKPRSFTHSVCVSFHSQMDPELRRGSGERGRVGGRGWREGRDRGWRREGGEREKRKGEFGK